MNLNNNEFKGPLFLPGNSYTLDNTFGGLPIKFPFAQDNQGRFLVFANKEPLLIPQSLLLPKVEKEYSFLSPIPYLSGQFFHLQALQPG